MRPIGLFRYQTETAWAAFSFINGVLRGGLFDTTPGRQARGHRCFKGRISRARCGPAVGFRGGLKVVEQAREKKGRQMGDFSERFADFCH